MAPRTTKAKAKKNAVRRKRVVRRRQNKQNVREMASLSQLVTVDDGVTNTMYGSSTLSLNQFDRAVQVARAYQEYRITHVKWTFKPKFDTFTATPDATVAINVPQFYYMIDKAQSIPLTATLATLRSMGAKPHRFDDKNVIAHYAPGVQTAVWDGATNTAPSAPRISPWLSTNAAPDTAWAPSTVDHGGIFYYLDTQGTVPGDGRYEYGVEVEVQFEFRKPLIAPSSSTTQARNPFASS